MIGHFTIKYIGNSIIIILIRFLNRSNVVQCIFKLQFQQNLRLKLHMTVKDFHQLDNTDVDISIGANIVFLEYHILGMVKVEMWENQ